MFSQRLWYIYIPYAEVFWRYVIGALVDKSGFEPEIKKIPFLYSRLESLPRKIVRTLKTLTSKETPENLFSSSSACMNAGFGSLHLRAYLSAALLYLGFSEKYDKTWLDNQLGRYCPFKLPGGFAQLDDSAKHEVLLDKLSLFYNSLVLGRHSLFPKKQA